MDPLLFYHSNVCHHVFAAFNVSGFFVFPLSLKWLFKKKKKFPYSRYCEDRKENATQKLNICEICWSVILFPIAFRYVIFLTISDNFSNYFGQAVQEYLN